MVQKEYAGTESKSETEKLLRKALEDYEDKKFVAKADKSYRRVNFWTCGQKKN